MRVNTESQAAAEAALTPTFYNMTNGEKLKSFLEQRPSGATLSEIAVGLGIKYNSASAAISVYKARLGIRRVRRGHYRLGEANGTDHGAATGTAISAEIAALEQQKEALRKRIQWTQEEVNRMADVLFQIWKRDPVKPITGEDCVRAMHVAVHPERWRKHIGGPSQLPTLEKALRDRILALVNCPEPEPAAIPASNGNGVHLPPVQPEPLNLQTLPFTELATAYLLRREQIEEQSRADVRALMDLIMESREAPASPSATVPCTVPARPTAPLKPSDDRVRVFTFGLLGSQAHELREEIQKCRYPVHYLKNVENGDRAHVPESADFVIFNNKHCNHGAFENVRNQTRQLGIRLVLATGAGKAKEAIRLLAQGKREPAAFTHLCV